jgi:hypothetical protein
MPELNGDRLRRESRVSAYLVLAVALALGSAACGSGTDRSSGEASASEADGGKYVPETDEGLGASVAILLDNSGSMERDAPGDRRPKYQIAREAIEAMLASTDAFVAQRPDFRVNVGLYQFDSKVETLVPVRPYDRGALVAALNTMPLPEGGTAIGDAMDVARADLYRAGTIRKYILVVTDGENTDGRSPESVAREIERRSEGGVRQYFIAFDVDAEAFAFVRDVRGDVLGARNGAALRASLDTIYRGRILAEAMDAGETLPAVRRDSGSTSGAGDSASSSTPRTTR